MMGPAIILAAMVQSMLDELPVREGVTVFDTHAARLEAEVPLSHRYTIAPADAEMLQGAATVAGEVRAFLLRQYVENHGVEALIGLFGEFIGLTNRLADQAHESAVICLIEAGYEPHSAEKVNSPTLQGALEGVKLAAGIDVSKTCGGCAFRLGSVANMSPSTTDDAGSCVEPGSIPFSCHEDMDARGNPTKACAGWAQARKKATTDDNTMERRMRRSAPPPTLSAPCSMRPRPPIGALRSPARSMASCASCAP